MLPNFLYIGPDKSGSSWIYSILDAHPDCWVPAAKDLYFFDRYYGRGLKWYSRQFRRAPADAIAVGELSHDYLFSQVAAERIYRDLPGVRVMASVRSPVERSFSHYLYLVRSGLTRVSFTEALHEFPELVENSKYAKHLKPHWERFGERLLVLFYDDLKSSPPMFASQIFNFLQLRFVDDLPYERRVLGAAKPRNVRLAQLMKRGAIISRDLGMPNLVGVLKRSPLRAVLYREFSSSTRPRPTIAEAQYVWSRCEADVAYLERMSGRSLAHWAPTTTAEDP